MNHSIKKTDRENTWKEKSFCVFPVFVYIFMTYVAHRSFTFHGNKVHFWAFYSKFLLLKLAVMVHEASHISQRFCGVHHQ